MFLLPAKDCEIDPTKITVKKSKQEALIAKRAEALIEYLKRLLEAIFASVHDCPQEMRVTFSHLRQAVLQVRHTPIATLYLALVMLY